MIDAKRFDDNFMAHNRQRLNEYGFGVLRLEAERNPRKYGAVKILTNPLDEEGVPEGYLKSLQLADKYKKFGVTLTVQNSGRGEGEVDIRRSFCIILKNERDVRDESSVREALDKLKAAEKEFYS